jgi:hypothetical protein
MLVPILFSSEARPCATSAIPNRTEDSFDVGLVYFTLMPREAKGIGKPLLYLASLSFALVRPVVSIHMFPVDTIN